MYDKALALEESVWSYQGKGNSLYNLGRKEEAIQMYDKASKLEQKTGVVKPSSWAKVEVEEAQEYNLTPSRVLSDFQNNITREEFCELVIKLYEAMSGKNAELPKGNKFFDTNNPEILKANALGIVNGISVKEFAPNNNVTREQMAVMFYNTIKAVDSSLVSGTYTANFTDKASISSWAKDAVAFVSNKGILGGMGDNKVVPKGNATREQAIALVKRTFEKIK